MYGGKAGEALVGVTVRLYDQRRMVFLGCWEGGFLYKMICIAFNHTAAISLECMV